MIRIIERNNENILKFNLSNTIKFKRIAKIRVVKSKWNITLRSIKKVRWKLGKTSNIII